MEHSVARAQCNSPYKSILLPISESKSFRWQSSSLRRINSPTNFSHSPRLHYHTKLSIRSSISDDTSSRASVYVNDEPDSMITVEDTQPPDTIDFGENSQNKVLDVDSQGENQLQQLEFLDNLDLKLDSDDTYSILLLGGGALVALYLATSIVGAIDSVPLIPKLLEVVGLSYSVWFITRYLIFKKNRQELMAKIEELKEQVLG